MSGGSGRCFLDMLLLVIVSEGGLTMEDIKQLRERYGLSRADMCRVFGIPYVTLQSWELGRRSCPVYVFKMMEMLLYLSDRLGGLEACKRGDE